MLDTKTGEVSNLQLRMHCKPKEVKTQRSPVRSSATPTDCKRCKTKRDLGASSTIATPASSSLATAPAESMVCNTDDNKAGSMTSKSTPATKYTIPPPALHFFKLDSKCSSEAPPQSRNMDTTSLEFSGPLLTTISSSSMSA